MASRRYTESGFIEYCEDECLDKFRVDAKYVYNTYYDNVEPNLGLITKYQNLAKPITQEELRIVMKVGTGTWKACRYYFQEFNDVIEHKRDIMKIKSEIDLQGAVALAPTNPKLIEMQLRMYNDDYKDKGNDVNITMPTELRVSFDDESTKKE